MEDRANGRSTGRRVRQASRRRHARGCCVCVRSGAPKDKRPAGQAAAPCLRGVCACERVKQAVGGAGGWRAHSLPSESRWESGTLPRAASDQPVAHAPCPVQDQEAVAGSGVGKERAADGRTAAPWGLGPAPVQRCGTVAALGAARQVEGDTSNEQAHKRGRPPAAGANLVRY